MATRWRRLRGEPHTAASLYDRDAVREERRRLPSSRRTPGMTRPGRAAGSPGSSRSRLLLPSRPTPQRCTGGARWGLRRRICTWVGPRPVGPATCEPVSPVSPQNASRGERLPGTPARLGFRRSSRASVRGYGGPLERCRPGKPAREGEPPHRSSVEGGWVREALAPRETPSLRSVASHPADLPGGLWWVPLTASSS